MGTLVRVVRDMVVVVAVAVVVVGLGLAALFAGVGWWGWVLAFGLLVVVPLVTLAAVYRSSKDVIESVSDAMHRDEVQRIKERYADGRLNEHQLERELERELDGTPVDRVKRRIEAAGRADESPDRDHGTDDRSGDGPGGRTAGANDQQARERQRQSDRE
jgi:uncharacterized membrane protein